MIVIKNMHDGGPSRYDEAHVKVDRSSVLGNPFRMCVDKDRECVCVLYDAYFNAMIDDDAAALDAMDIGDERRTPEFRSRFMDKLASLVSIHERGRGLVLYCWCAPRRCHADTIKRYVLSKSNRA